VFGVAPSATAAEVLADSTGVAADTIHKLLIEHSLNRPADHRYNLPCGATVIVDEAGMLGTRELLSLAALADLRGWRLALVGDPLQFSAVGRGGMYALLVDTFGAVELDRVHRFDHDWERDASLLLRHGDVRAAEIHDRHGRLHGGTAERMQSEILTMWWEHRQQGRVALMMSPSLDVVETLNGRAQQLRVRAGELDPDSRHATAGRYDVYVSDEIATRQNDGQLRTDCGGMVRNRAVWTVDTVHRDGSLTATGAAGTIHLPADYVRQYVELGYARTGIAGQGRTVSAGLGYYDGPANVRNLYVRSAAAPPRTTPFSSPAAKRSRSTSSPATWRAT
jgi:ATP-dependent exoDNAse (exonuclease V) alpha subunit